MNVAANIRALFAKCNELRLSQQGTKTQQGYLRQDIAALDIRVSAVETLPPRVSKLEAAAQCIAVSLLCFFLTIFVGLSLR